jgi:hypothetical protein
MKKPYCCDDSRNINEQYYDRQQRGEGEFPVYVGRYSQRGHGLGNIGNNIIGSLFRRILPVLTAIAPHLLRTGASVIEDVRAGKSWKESAIKRVSEGFHRIAFGNSPDPVIENARCETYSLDAMAFIHEGSCECA